MRIKHPNKTTDNARDKQEYIAFAKARRDPGAASGSTGTPTAAKAPAKESAPLMQETDTAQAPSANDVGRAEHLLQILSDTWRQARRAEANKRPVADPKKSVRDPYGTYSDWWSKNPGAEYGLGPYAEDEVPLAVVQTGGSELYRLVVQLPDGMDLTDWSKLSTVRQRQMLENSKLRKTEQWALLNADDHYLEALGKLWDLQKNPRRPSVAEIIALDVEFSRFAEAQANQTGNAPNPLAVQLAAQLAAQLGGIGTRSTAKPKTTPGLFPTPGPLPTPGPQAGPQTTSLPQPGPGMRQAWSVPRNPWKTYGSADEAIQVWADKNRPLSKDKERCAFLHKRTNGNGQTVYIVGNTVEGMDAIPQLRIRDNVVLPFIKEYLSDRILGIRPADSEMTAFIHTHPKPPSGYTVAKVSDEDRLLLKLPGIDAIYVVPYENDEIIPG